MSNRIFYASQAIAIAKTGHDSTSVQEFHVMKGVQSAGVSTDWTIEETLEYGQVQSYESSEISASCEVTVEKVIDGERSLYLQAVGNIGKTNLVAATNSRCDVYFAIYPDSVSAVSGQTKQNTLLCSGMVVSSVNYNYSVDGPATESISLVGDNKFWDNATYGMLAVSPNTMYGTGGASANDLNGADTPASGVVRRAQFKLYESTLPAEVVSQANDVPGSSGIQSISVSADFGREDLNELGRQGAYARTATFPIEVTSEFEVIATRGDQIAISGRGPSLKNRTIILKDDAGTVIDLGTKNKLNSVSYQGGDTGGGNATVTFSYTNQSYLKVDGGGNYW